MSKKHITLKVAKKLAIAGNRKGHTVQTLAAKSEVSVTTINRILGSAVKPYNPTVGTIAKLAKGLNMSIGNFMDVSDIRV